MLPRPMSPGLLWRIFPRLREDREIARARFEAQSTGRRLRQTEADMQAVAGRFAGKKLFFSLAGWSLLHHH